MGMDQDDVVLAPWTTIKYRVSGTTLTNTNQSAAVGRRPATRSTRSSNLYPGATALYPQLSATQIADTPQPVRFANVDQIAVKAASTEEIPQAIEQITGAVARTAPHQRGPDRRLQYPRHERNHQGAEFHDAIDERLCCWWWR